MPVTVAAHREVSEIDHTQIRQQKPRNRNQISPVMQKVQSLLPPAKPAQHLAILIDEPLGNCQKLLCGQRRENASQLRKLLRTWMGKDVLFALLGDANPEWFSKYRKQLDVNQARRQLIESKRAIEAIQDEIGQ